MKKVTIFETVHENAAGIDIGAKQIFVWVDGNEVVSFNTFTDYYYKCVEYLQENNITRVAMEATGVYWMALYSMLENCGLKVSLVNPKEAEPCKRCIYLANFYRQISCFTEINKVLKQN